MLLYSQALNCVMVHDSTGIYFGWCDIHCKLLSTFRVCVWPDKSMCIIYMLCIGIWGIQQCKIIAFCIIFDWYFVHVVLFLFHVWISAPLESVYSFHIVIFPSHIIFPHLYGVSFLFYGLLSLICYEQWSAFCVVFFIQCSALGTVSYAGLPISRQRFSGQITFDRATREIHNSTLLKDTTGWQCAAKILVWQGFVRYEDLFINRILHAIRMLEMYTLGKFSFTLM